MNLLHIVKNNYKRNGIGYACIGIIVSAIIIFNGMWTCRLSANDTGIDDIINRYGNKPFDETFWDINNAMERLGRYNVFVSESSRVAMAFAVITLIVLGGVFVLSLRHRQNSLKCSEQILYIGMTLSVYGGLLYSLTYWLGHISILIRQGGAATRNCIVPPYHLSTQEAIFRACRKMLIFFQRTDCQCDRNFVSFL